MLSKKLGLSIEGSMSNSINIFLIVANTYVWFICTSTVLRQIIQTANLLVIQLYIVWTISFLGASTSIIVGAYFISKFCNRKRFLIIWVLLGIIASLTPIFITTFSFIEILFVSIFFNISFGLGLPFAMAEFSSNTNVENRAKLSGAIWFLVIMLSGILMNFISDNLMVSSFILTLWRTIGLIAAFSYQSNTKKTYASFTDVIRERPFISYLMPWTMFSLVNYLSTSVGINFLGEDFVNTLMLISSLVTGVSAIFGGFISDIMGRKRTTILGFILLGFGYSLLGIYPQNVIVWHFYAIVDGVAWGIFCVIFFFTIWGELAGHKSGEKYYALGSIPYLLSNYLRLTFGPLIAANVSIYSIFSFAALFLFMAVVPLMFAPETLPEKTLRERELRSYIEKAKRVREKFTKG